MKKTITLTLVFFLLTTSLTIGSVTIQKRNISFDGNTLYVGGSGPNNYTKIQDAINDANSGDTIFVFDDSSPYHQYVVINKSINLVGENKETTIIDGKGYWSNPIISIHADGVTLTGFTIGNIDIYSRKGIDMISNNSNISNNIIKYNRILGIVLHDSSCNKISNNTIINNEFAGINLYSSSYNDIFQNNISNNGFGENPNGYMLLGLYVGMYSNKNKIYNNNIRNNKNQGLRIGFSYYNFIEDNNFIKNGNNSYFEGSILTHWNGNYWDDKTGFGPKIIIGKIGMWSDYLHKFFFIPWVNIDWHPAQEPYDI